MNSRRPHQVTTLGAAALLFAAGPCNAGLVAAWDCSASGQNPDRRIEVYVRDASPDTDMKLGDDVCRVYYTKGESSEVPWNAQNNADYCLPKAQGLAGKLESLGMTCRQSEGTSAKAAEDTPG